MHIFPKMIVLTGTLRYIKWSISSSLSDYHFEDRMCRLFFQRKRR